MSKYYIDCEFDGHNGPLLSIAIVPEDGCGIHIQTLQEAHDPWVLTNVMPHMETHEAETMAKVGVDTVGSEIAAFIGNDTCPIIVADSPVDIARFCHAISTGPDGSYAPCISARLIFEVHDVDCYPTNLLGAVQHNAWWDAMALRNKLSQVQS